MSLYGPDNSFYGGIVPNPITSIPSINYTNDTTIINYKGSPFLSFANSVSSTFMGIAAAQTIIAGLPGVVPQPFNTVFGNNAAQFSTAALSESTFVGSLAGQYSNNSYTTGVGCHVIGFDTAPICSSAFGTDAQRNWMSGANAFNTSIGAFSMLMGTGYNNTALGFNALNGNSGILVLSGTPTANEVISVTIACDSTALYAGTMAGNSKTVTYNVGASPTLTNIATGLAAAISADTTLAPLNNGAHIAGVVDTINVQFFLIGSSILGQKYTVTPSTTGTTVITYLASYSGTDNIAIGQQSLLGNYLTTGSFNTAIGTKTLNRVTTGSFNTALGLQSGFAITTGSRNILISGQNAGQSITTGSDNVAIGDTAGAASVTSSNSVNIGSSAGQFALGNSTWPNAHVGYLAGRGSGAATFFGSVGIGYGAGQIQTTANWGTYIGTRAGTAVTTANNSCFVGAFAGTAVVGGDKNTLIGFNAGQTINSGFFNTTLGFQSGPAITTGDNNICIGHDSGGTLTTGTNNIIVGNSLNTAGTGTSNTINIGGIFKVTGTNTAGTSTASVAGTFNTGAFTVGTLPAAGTAGRRAYVTDALLPTFLGTLTGGGAVVCPVFDNGIAWVAG